MRVFTIPASRPFIATLLSALVEGRLVDGFDARHNPQALADATIYLPTQRAARMARTVFLEVLGTDAVLLPRIVVLNDIDEDEIAFAEAASVTPGAASALDPPPALGGLQRRLILARLVGQFARQLKPRHGEPPLIATAPAQILALADDLARLMDDMATREIDWTRLDRLVPDDFDQYWQLTLQFIDIARSEWPKILSGLGRIEPVIRRDMLIAAEAARLTTHARGPVIAAGSTGSMPATAKFLATVARLPNGAVVLPGLDTDLDDDAWRKIDLRDRDETAHPASSHPQFALHALLQRFGITRSDVHELQPPAVHGRELLASEAMRPSDATTMWHTRLSEPAVASRIARSLDGLAIVSAPNADIEALAIACAMREAIAQDKSAALVTPDRALARRVMTALGRWQLPFDDSGGESLMDTSAGVFARLACDVVAERFAPPALLALLKHPLFRLGRDDGGWRDAIETLEIAVLRGPRPAAGSKGLAADLSIFREEMNRLKRREPSLLHAYERRAQLGNAALVEAGELVTALSAAFEPLDVLLRPQAANPDSALASPEELSFTALFAAHRRVIEALSIDASGAITCCAGEDGEALDAAFDDAVIATASDLAADAIVSSLADYPDLFQTAFADRIVRQPQLPDARLRIYGPLEARLTHCDRIILGGLTEGVWPPAPRSDPWLSRPMRQELGLDLPERRIGLAAHDFAQMLGAPEVIVTHAAKAGGSPAVASRFLHRLEAVAGRERWEQASERGRIYLDYAHALDHSDGEPIPSAQPKPKPPRSARPTRLSVTEIEDWLRDPYTIYARHILKLRPLDPVDMPPSAADRGSAIHNVLGDFGVRYPDELPDDVERTLREIGRTHFQPLMDRPEAQALWWPRFLRVAGWFSHWERDRRIDVSAIEAETRGEITIPVGDRTFTLSCRADRIERRRDGTFAVIDYKTGAPPSDKQVRLGLSPQLTLEAAILRQGGFRNIPAGRSVSEIAYVRLSGNNPPGIHFNLPLKRAPSDPGMIPDQAADEALQKLRELITIFDDDAQPYVSLSLPMWTNTYGRYDDLARVREWTIIGDDEE